ncbi:MAG: polysaccharide biosynthesis/export family protein [Terriglobales bacterium]
MRFTPTREVRFPFMLVLLLFCGPLYSGAAIAGVPPEPVDSAPAAQIQPLIRLNPGDTVSITVFEQPDLNSTSYVSDDGTLPVALAGAVHVAGLTPAAAGQAIATALREGKFLVDPHVTVTVVSAFGQRISVLGEVVQPGRYPIDSRTTFLDLLAQAGGRKESGADVAYLLHTNPDGTSTRQPIDLTGLQSGHGASKEPQLQGGDMILVPKAEHYFIYGEVTKTGQYRLDHELTVLQAIVQAGGITAKGSMNRVVVTRKGPDCKGTTAGVKLSEMVHPDDEIRVKESIF